MSNRFQETPKDFIKRLGAVVSKEQDANNGSALAMTMLAYEESTRNLDFKVKCANWRDFCRCLIEIKQYNYFDCANVIKAFTDEFTAEERKVMIFCVGREGSPVVYLMDGFFPQIENFKQRIDKVARNAKGDECGMQSNREYRIWWD